jgi:release factor glutamine methyltransferase
VSPAPDGTVTWRELLAEAVARLGAAGSDSAEVDARWVVADCLGVGRAELGASLGEQATERSVARFDELVARRAEGEPLQYVLGSWGFRSLDLMVDRRVLIPRPETESVVDVALTELDRLGGAERPTTVVDLGTGSGAIGLSIATERVRSEVWLTDVSEPALEVARANLVGIGRGAARVRVATGDWFGALPDSLRGRLDLVVSNPPYVPVDVELPSEVARWEPTSALYAGADGTSALRRLIALAPTWLQAQGALVCELSPEQAEVVRELATEHFEQAEVVDDLTGRARTVVARRPRVARTTDAGDGGAE